MNIQTNYQPYSNPVTSTGFDPAQAFYDFEVEKFVLPPLELLPDHTEAELWDAVFLLLERDHYVMLGTGISRPVRDVCRVFTGNLRQEKRNGRLTLQNRTLLFRCNKSRKKRGMKPIKMDRLKQCLREAKEETYGGIPIVEYRYLYEGEGKDKKQVREIRCPGLLKFAMDRQMIDPKRVSPDIHSWLNELAIITPPPSAEKPRNINLFRPDFGSLFSLLIRRRLIHSSSRDLLTTPPPIDPGFCNSRARARALTLRLVGGRGKRGKRGWLKNATERREDRCKMPENQNNEHYHQHDTGRQQNALGRIPESVDEFSIRTRTKCQEMEIFLGRALELSRQNQRSLAATEWLIENIHERYLKHQMNSPTGYFVHMMRKGFDVPHHVISEHNRDAYRQQREEEERLKIKSERKTAERQNYLEDLYARNEYQFVFREAQKYSAQGAFLSLLLQEPALIPPDPLLQMVQKAGEGMKDCPPFLAPVSWSWFIVQITKALTDYKTSSSSTSGLPSAFIARRSLMTSNHCVTKSIAS